MRELVKPTYEELEHRFQSYCKHDGGTTWTSEGKFCAICQWPDGKCQHRRAKPSDNYCVDCGEKLRQDAKTAELVAAGIITKVGE